MKMAKQRLVGFNSSVSDLSDIDLIAIALCNSDSIKNDFLAQLHKFMASLTDTRWKMDGKTVLYQPYEGTVANLDATVVKNKEFDQRLESL